MIEKIFITLLLIFAFSPIIDKFPNFDIKESEKSVFILRTILTSILSILIWGIYSFLKESNKEIIKKISGNEKKLEKYKNFKIVLLFYFFPISIFYLSIEGFLIINFFFAIFAIYKIFRKKEFIFSVIFLVFPTIFLIQKTKEFFS